MSFRARLLLASLPLALLPLALFGLGARRDLGRRVEDEYAARVDQLADVIGNEIRRESERIGERLGSLADGMSADPLLRVALLDGQRSDGTARSYLLDYAPRAMPLAGLDVFRIQRADGQVLSSGHFRNEHGALDPSFVNALGPSGERVVLAEVATPAGTMLVLSRGVPLRVGAETFTLVGGSAVDDAFLARLEGGTGLDVELMTGETRAGAMAAGSRLVRDVELPFVASGAESVARFVVRASDAPLLELRRDLDRWLLGAAVVASMLAGLLAVLIAAHLASPIAALARRAGRIDLDRLDVSFATRRLDEIGDLSRVLDRMTGRLRTSAARLRDAERRATTGDIARQVHHDVRNGLIPIRNVLGHLAQVSREEPERLREVFLERQSTLDSGVAYLQSLASNYARMSPAVERRPCDVNRIASDVVADAGVAHEGRDGPLAGGGLPATGHPLFPVRVAADLHSGLQLVLGDPVALRRVVENLVVNALESLEPRAAGRPGSVLVWTRPGRGSEGATHVQIGVSDNGRGMSSDERAHMFDDFYTTKATGTGLGLSIVRRLVGDMGGRIDVESTPGEGTRITVELPAAAGAPTEPEAVAGGAPHAADATLEHTR